ncbi:LutC/YkgG family protein [Modestobacter lacusdianchii]
MSAREEVLAAVRRAVGPDPAPVAVPRDYSRAPLTGPADADRFATAVEEYAATVHRVAADATEAELSALVDRLVAGRPAVVPHDLPAHLRPSGDVRVDSPDAPLAVAELDRVHSVVTLGRLGIAATGSVVLDAGPGQGRRAVTLVPDHHVCVLTVGQLVDTVPQAFAALDPVRPLTVISGPSATSDIELDRVEGVHGPRTLDVVLVG